MLSDFVYTCRRLINLSLIAGTGGYGLAALPRLPDERCDFYKFSLFCDCFATDLVHFDEQLASRPSS